VKGLSGVISTGGRDVGELLEEFPFSAHVITAPRRRSERESLNGLWVTERKKVSLLSRLAARCRFSVAGL
jgi:hypothetical protein